MLQEEVECLVTDIVRIDARECIRVFSLRNGISLMRGSLFSSTTFSSIFSSSTFSPTIFSATTSTQVESNVENFVVSGEKEDKFPNAQPLSRVSPKQIDQRQELYFDRRVTVPKSSINNSAMK